MRYCELENISLLQMQACIKIEELGSFTNAAKSLHLTQSNLSKKISDLEMNLGVLIFIHGKNVSVRPTKAGKILISSWKKVLSEMNESYISSLEIQTCKDKKIILGLTYTTSEEKLLFPVINQFKKNYPEIEIRIEHGYVDNLLDSLYNENIDLLFLPKCWYTKINKDLTESTICAENPLTICMLSTNDLAKKSTITINDLKNKKFIIPRNLLNVYDKLFENANFTPDIAYVTNDIFSQMSNLLNDDEIYLSSTYRTDDPNPSVITRLLNVEPSQIYVVNRKELKHESANRFKQACIKSMCKTYCPFT